MNVVDKYWQKMPKKPKRRSIASTSNGNRKGSVSLDNLNLLLIKELLDDAEVKSADMAARYNSPLSTIQRRRAKLEHSILSKRYDIDIRHLGWREADLLISVDGGDSEDVAKKLIEAHTANISATSLRIGDPEVNIVAQAFYQTTGELQQLIEKIRATPSVKTVHWSEVVKTIGTNQVNIVLRILDPNL